MVRFWCPASSPLSASAWRRRFPAAASRAPYASLRRCNRAAPARRLYRGRRCRPAASQRGMGVHGRNGSEERSGGDQGGLRRNVEGFHWSVLRYGDVVSSRRTGGSAHAAFKQSRWTLQGGHARRHADAGQAGYRRYCGKGRRRQRCAVRTPAVAATAAAQPQRSCNVRGRRSSSRCAQARQVRRACAVHTQAKFGVGGEIGGARAGERSSQKRLQHEHMPGEEHNSQPCHRQFERPRTLHGAYSTRRTASRQAEMARNGKPKPNFACETPESALRQPVAV